MRYIVVVVLVLIGLILGISYLAERNFAVCSFFGGKLEEVNIKCVCTSKPCVVTTCSHENRCVWGEQIFSL